MTKLETQHRKGEDDNSCVWSDRTWVSSKVLENQCLVSDTKHPQVCWLGQSFRLLSYPTWLKVSAISCFPSLASKLLCSVVVRILSWVWKYRRRDRKKGGDIYDVILNMLSAKCPFERWTQAWKKYSRTGETKRLSLNKHHESHLFKAACTWPAVWIQNHSMWLTFKQKHQLFVKKWSIIFLVYVCFRLKSEWSNHTSAHTDTACNTFIYLYHHCSQATAVV